MATARQHRAVKKTIENLRKSKPESMGKVLRDSGYPYSSSTVPNQITKSKGFQELMEQYLPEENVIREHGNLLTSSRHENYIFPRDENDKVIKEIVEAISGCKLIRIRQNNTAKRAYYWCPDNNSRKDAIDLAYKLRGRYKPQQVEVRTFTGWTPEELDEYAKTGLIPARFVDASQS